MLDQRYVEDSGKFHILHEYNIGAKLFVVWDSEQKKWIEDKPTKVKYKILLSHPPQAFQQPPLVIEGNKKK